MKQQAGKAAALLAWVSCVTMLGALPLRAGTAAPQENEEDGVTVPQGHKEAYEAAKEQMKEAPQEKHSSGSWYLAGAAGMEWSWFDRGSIGNTPYSGNLNEAFIGGLIGGYYWHDPDKWGNLSFSVDAVGLYDGSTINSQVGSAGSSSGATFGDLVLGGTIGYRIAKSYEPFVGFYGGGQISQVSGTRGTHGDVWSFVFGPALGIRYFIPNSHWFVGMVGVFAFEGDLNGYNQNLGGKTLNVSGSSYLYEPIVMMTIGYAF
ncbi:hypothetical protein [Verrucomicrobium sp. 3C]|uniref:hypothetical protein n=1 Tax=Verrucomicrobium sp. 3C TaxID=1134055 RepID=UPI000372B184|nr:hypothetical protein [Verrucomicrobium sp. 3C]